MGFNEDLAMFAARKYGTDMQAAIKFLASQQQTTSPNMFGISRQKCEENKSNEAKSRSSTEIPSPPLYICDNCSKTTARRRCGRCKSVYYCDRQCQTTHWKKHKKICKKSDAQSNKKAPSKQLHNISALTINEKMNGNMNGDEKEENKHIQSTEKLKQCDNND